MAKKDSIDVIKVGDKMRAIFLAKAEEALQVYTDEKLAYDDDNYPFERHDQRSIRDNESQSVTPTPTGILIAVEAPAAEFAEYGNDPGGGEIESDTPMFIKLKSGRSAKGKLSFSGGKVGFVKTFSVQAVEAPHRLKNAIKKAFGVAIE